MAGAYVLPFHPIRLRASATATHRSSDTSRRSSSSPPSSLSWWSPLFGWSSEPDYIDSSSSNIADDREQSLEKGDASETNPGRCKFTPGCFTAEKARRLRIMTTDTEVFHDVMYHSAIASRLASDFSGLSDP